ncbi:MAG: hypothetical protein ABI721_01220 [Candidatus Dojkabacteria bacterium]
MSDIIENNLLKPSQGHLTWGNEITLEPNIIEGAEENSVLKIQPEVVNIFDDEGCLLTLKIIYHLSPSITTAEKIEINTITLGDFGQNDPIRMWMTASLTSSLLSTPEYLRVRLMQAKNIYGTDARIKLDTLLYNCLNTIHNTDLKGKYSVGNIHNSVKWQKLPPEIVDEVQRRINNHLPINYQYLNYLLETLNVPELSALQEAELISQRAMDQMNRSTDHKIKVATGSLAKSIQSIYKSLLELLPSIEFRINDKGLVLLADIDYYMGNFIINFNNHLISDQAVINFGASIVDLIQVVLKRSKSYITASELSIMNAIVSEEIIKRLYNVIKEFDPLLITMTLGEFASSIYDLSSNNSDTNLKEMLTKSDNSAPRIASLLKMKRMFEQ